MDTIAIFQYMDIGTSSLRIGSVASKREGFTNLEYSLYMFNTTSEEIVLDYNKDFPGAAIIALMNDPEITANPSYKNKVRKFNKGFGRWETLYFINELPDDVISDKVMSYIKDGIKIQYEDYGDMEWTGLMEVIPNK